jgi:hypothetical protein
MKIKTGLLLFITTLLFVINISWAGTMEFYLVNKSQTSFYLYEDGKSPDDIPGIVYADAPAYLDARPFRNPILWLTGTAIGKNYVSKSVVYRSHMTSVEIEISIGADFDKNGGLYGYPYCDVTIGNTLIKCTVTPYDLNLFGKVVQVGYEVYIQE